jgi:predicted alpha/beta hydrolase
LKQWRELKKLLRLPLLPQEDLSSSGHPLKYVSHTFSGGASCVLTGRPRTAEVCVQLLLLLLPATAL